MIVNTTSDLSRDYWESRYRNGQTGWDRGSPSPEFVDLLEQTPKLPTGSIGVVGCGTGHDAVLFARHGFSVTGFDFAPSAVAAAKALARDAEVGHSTQFEQADIFALPAHFAASFDYVLERACLTAIAPKDRPRYWQTIRTILKPNGVLIGSLLFGERDSGPPFPIRVQEFREQVADGFRIESEHIRQTHRSSGFSDALVLLRRT